MSSYIRLNILGNAPKIEISDSNFDAIAQARIVLTAAFALEESYDLLIDNYIEVEQELLTITTNNAVRNQNEYQDSFQFRTTINRRIVNLLTAARLYFDQAPQRLAKCATDPERARTEFKQLTNKHYDAIFGYRFLEALRNHVQHCGIAVHNFTRRSVWTTEEDEPTLEFSTLPFAERRYLAEDDKFKKKILEEMPDKVALMLVIRQYIQCIGEQHKLVRTLINDRIKISRKIIQELISAYAEVNQGATTGLTAIKTTLQGQQQSVPLMLDWDDIREKLVTKNSSLAALSQIVIAGRAQ